MTIVAHPLLKWLALPAALLTSSACVQADDIPATPAWSFEGFGSIGVVHSTEKQADYAANVLYPGKAGFSRDWSPEVDSRLGAQLSVNFDKRWSAVLQVVSERNLQNSWRPMVEWVNVKYQATPELSVRLGRIALPLFLAGDYRKAGYALPWVRPPVELYGGLPISNNDGVDATWLWQSEGVKHSTQLFYGRTSRELEPGYRAHGKGVSGIAHVATSGALTVRAGFITSSLSADFGRELFGGLRQYGPAGQALADRYEIRDKRSWVLNAGASYDPGGWFVMGEAGRFNYNSALGDFYAAYASAGVRLGAWTPYVLAGRARALPPAAAANAAYLNAYLNGYLSRITAQDSAAIGLRWDFGANAALKLQYDRLHTRGGSSGTFINVQPGFRSGGHAGVTSVLLDFVF